MLEASELQEAVSPAASALAQAVSQYQRQAGAEAPPIDPIYAQLRDQSRFWIQRVAVPLIMVVGLFGNLITIVIMTRRRMRSTTNLYLAALAFVDMLYLVLTFVLGLSHYPNMAERKYYLYWRLKPLLMLFADACSNTSVWLTVTFTIERFIAVKYPMKGKVWCTEARAKKLIAGVFAFALMFALPVPFEWQVIERQVKRSSSSVASAAPNSSSLMIVGAREAAEIVGDGAQRDEGVIMLALDNTEFGRDETYKTIYYRLTAILFYFLPLISVTLFNGFLIHSVHQSRKERNRMTIRRNEPATANTGQPSELSLSSVQQQKWSQKMDRKQQQHHHHHHPASLATSGCSVKGNKCESSSKALAMLSNKSCSSVEVDSNNPYAALDPNNATKPSKANGVSELGSSSKQIKICVDLYNDNNSNSPCTGLSLVQKKNCDKVSELVASGAPIEEARQQQKQQQQHQHQQQDGQTSAPPDDNASRVESTITSPASTRAEIQVNHAATQRDTNPDQATSAEQACQKFTGRRDNDLQNSNINGHPFINNANKPRSNCARSSLVTEAADLTKAPALGGDYGARLDSHVAHEQPPISSSRLNNESLRNSSSSSVCSLASPSSNAQQATNVNTSVIASGPVITASSQERRITIMLIAVVLLFLVCQIPSAAMLIYTSVHETPPNTNEYAVLLALGNIFNFLAAINAAGNFILYSFLSKKYRRTFVILFCSCLKSHNKKPNSSTSTMVTFQSRLQSISRSSNHQSIKARQTSYGPVKQACGPPTSAESTMKHLMGNNAQFKQQYITPLNNSEKMDDGKLIQDVGKKERVRYDTLV